MRFPILLILLFLFTDTCLSQEYKFRIDSIHISGNKKTRDYIILNELDFKTGDSILLSSADRIFERNTSRMLGTALFVKVKFNISEISTQSNSVEIGISVNEAWYIYPYFYFDLTDRNLSEWIYEHNASINRINITINLKHNNLTGNKDIIELKYQAGITKKRELIYSLPYLSSKSNLGFFFNILDKRSEEIAYNTLNDKLVYYKSEDKNVFDQLRVTAGLTYRSSIYNNHFLKISYFNNKTDSIVFKELNPRYFKNSIKQRYLDIHYIFNRDRRNYRIYPTSGDYFFLEIEKAGLGFADDINQLILWSGYEKHIPVMKNLFTSFNFEVKKSLINENPPYFNNKALGYSDRFLNGYELYVIDGEDYFYLKTSQKYNFLHGDFNLKKIISLPQFRNIPYYVYFTLNFDTGYVNNNTNFALNNFTNRMLYGYGAGLDFVIYHNLLRFTYSLNHIGEQGFYFHLKSIF